MVRKNIFSAVAGAYNSVSLILRIFIGIVIGAILGLLLPGAVWISSFGSLFVGALKGVAPVLVFALVSSSLVKGSARLDRRFGLVILLYMLSTLFASFIAVAASILSAVYSAIKISKKDVIFK